MIFFGGRGNIDMGLRVNISRAGIPLTRYKDMKIRDAEQYLIMVLSGYHFKKGETAFPTPVQSSNF